MEYIRKELIGDECVACIPKHVPLFFFGDSRVRGYVKQT